MRDDLLIGEFSELTGISKRMIRHFDMLGLLAPHHIDGDTGYRYYSQHQAHVAQKIKFLQELGFSLKEIHMVLTEPIAGDTLLEMLKDQEVKLRYDADHKIGQLLRLKQVINYVVSHDKGLDELPFYEARRRLQMNTYESLKEEMKQLLGPMIMAERIEENYTKWQGTLVSLITFDIDSFLHVNEEYSYDAGDKVIYKLFDIIRSSFKDLLAENPDNMLSRNGGDEFAILLVGANLSAIQAAAQAVLDAFMQVDFSDDGGPKQMTSSCGIASSDHILHPADLNHQSSKALIAAKRAGRNRIQLHT